MSYDQHTNHTTGIKRVETHRHYGGSCSADMVWQSIQRHQLSHLASSYDEVKAKLTCQPDEPKSFSNFLAKFTILDNIPWDRVDIDAATADICRRAIADNLSGVCISISINKYVVAGGWKPAEIWKFLAAAFAQHCAGSDLVVCPLLALRYDANWDNQRLYNDIILGEVPDLVYGVDLIGDERHFNDNDYRGIIAKWNQAGKITRAHVGEFPDQTSNLYYAIHDLMVNRVAHGIFGTTELWREAAEAHVAFDLALHSNFYTGAVVDLRHHPLPRMLDAGCTITLSTDDPIQFNCSLDDEFNLATHHQLITDHTINQSILSNAVDLLETIKST